MAYLATLDGHPAEEPVSLSLLPIIALVGAISVDDITVTSEKTANVTVADKALNSGEETHAGTVHAAGELLKFTVASAKVGHGKSLDTTIKIRVRKASASFDKTYKAQVNKTDGAAVVV